LSPLIYLRAEFHKNRGVGKKDFGTIEYLLRRGRRQLETYQDPGIRDLH
jgi:succinate dehydrogenase assembly factor 1